MVQQIIFYIFLDPFGERILSEKSHIFANF